MTAVPSPLLNQWNPSATVFDHSIIWEDDMWRRDVFDVETVHERPRKVFCALLDQVTVNPQRVHSRIQMFHGPSGAGKTHLMRALRTYAHKERRGYFAYAQMTSDISNYAEFYLRRIINSLEKPYDPEHFGESGLHHLSNALMAEAEEIDPGAVDDLRFGEFSPSALSDMVVDLADDIVSMGPFAAEDLDAQLVRALLYLQRNDPRIDQRVRQYLKGVPLSGRNQDMVGALETHGGEDRAFSFIESLGRLTYAAEGSPLIFCIDQVEDLRFFDNAEERFQKAIRDLIQIVNRVPSAIVLISCLDDFYNSMRQFLPQSFIDRVERSEPLFVGEMRNATEARLILQKRIDAAFQAAGETGEPPRVEALFGDYFFEEVSGLSTRRLLEVAHDRWLELIGEKGAEPSHNGSFHDKPSLATADFSDPKEGASSAVQVGETDVALEPVTKLTEQDDTRTAVRAMSKDDMGHENDLPSCSLSEQGNAQPPNNASVTEIGVVSPGEPLGVDTQEALDAQSLNETFVAVEPSTETIVEPVVEAQNLEQLWDLFQKQHKPILPVEEDDLSALLASALMLSESEIDVAKSVHLETISWIEDVSALDITVREAHERDLELRLFLCNRSSQGGGLRRQIERVMTSAAGRQAIVVRTSEFPPNAKSTTATAVRQYLQTGGLRLVIPIYEWEAMAKLRDFCQLYHRDPGLLQWRKQEQVLLNLHSIRMILGGGKSFELSGLKSGTSPVAPVIPQETNEDARASAPLEQGGQASHQAPLTNVPSQEKKQAEASVEEQEGKLADETHDRTGGRDVLATPEPQEDIFAQKLKAVKEAKKLAEAQAEMEDSWVGQYVERAGFMQPKKHIVLPKSNGLLRLGHGMRSEEERVCIDMSLLRRHAAVLGGSGSGKTTLALTMIEQILMEGVPVVLIDRKGDLCSYARQQVWEGAEGEVESRVQMRDALREQIDVAVYTPGRTTGRPVSITLLPKGMQELPEHEQSQLANLSAAALGEMLHFGTSPTHQRYSGILSVALKLLAEKSHEALTLADLIMFMEDDSSLLPDMVQRMDPTGRLRGDLVAQLDSLCHRNFSLFEGSGEPLSMDSFLGLGPYKKQDKTKLSIIYTGFLGDNENILFWVAQFLSEALRFCQRNPSDDLQALVMFDEADLYIPANGKPATKEPLESLLKRARSAGMGIMLATQSPGDLDYKSRDQITSWFIGKVREDTALRKLKAAFAAQSGIDPAIVLPNQTVGEFHLLQEGLVKAMKSQRSLINADQIPFDQIEEISRQTLGKKPRDQFKLPLD